jgi:hypothetical protein
LRLMTRTSIETCGMLRKLGSPGKSLGKGRTVNSVGRRGGIDKTRLEGGTNWQRELGMGSYEPEEREVVRELKSLMWVILSWLDGGKKEQHWSFKYFEVGSAGPRR